MRIDVDGGRIQSGVSVVMYPWMATCAETRDRLSAHLDGELTGWDAKRVRRHLARCRLCQEMLRSLARTIDGLRSLGQGDVHSTVPSAADAVVARIRRGDSRDP